MKTKNELLKKLAKSIRPLKKISVSKWADKYRQLPSDAAEPGQWKTSRVPYMREVMDAFTDNRIHRVVVKCCSQVGKSEVMMNVAARFAHIDPCAMMIVQPTLEMAMDFSKSRLSKMIADTKVLTPLFYDKGISAKTRDANQTILSKFFTGGRLVLAGANSPAGLASRPIRILLCDEVDRFPDNAGGEGDPVALAAKRTTTFWNFKIGLFSTPTTEGASRIDVEYLAGTQEEWRHRCPNCGEFHSLDYRQMKVDSSETRDEYGNRTVIVRDVKWQCPDCGFEFDELEMKNAPQKYFAQNPDALANSIRSFWLNGFSSPWLSWQEIMREWLEARGSAIREQVVYNTRFGLSYQVRGEFEDENAFLERREDYPAELPQGVLVLTAGVDVQANRLEYEIVGWGFSEESWGVVRGIIRGAPNQRETWKALDEVLDREYHFANGLTLKVARTFIDSGYATRTVYDYCAARATKGRFAIKGTGQIGVPLLFKYGNPRHSGILLTILGVNDGKQTVMSRLGISTQGAEYCHFPRDDGHFSPRGYDSVYFKQLISERRVIRKSGGIASIVWEPVSSGVRNESLDIRVYATAAMKSCIGRNNAEQFWKRQADALRGNFTSRAETKKAAPQKRVTASRELNIWA